MKTQNYNILTFKSGLNYKVRLNEKIINPIAHENWFNKQFGIEAHFMKNQSCAYANKLCAQIFLELSKKLKISFAFPPVICCYNRSDLADIKAAFNFCIPDTQEVLKNDDPFPGRSLFFANINESLQDKNAITEKLYHNKKISSSHFLALEIHEWLHSLQLDYIYKHFGYGGNCQYLSSLYPVKNHLNTGYKLIQNLENKKLTNEENQIVYNILGEYSIQPHNQYLEIFCEAFTKFICDSLFGIELIKNPFDLLKNTPKEFQNI